MAVTSSGNAPGESAPRLADPSFEEQYFAHLEGAELTAEQIGGVARELKALLCIPQRTYEPVT